MPAGAGPGIFSLRNGSSGFRKQWQQKIRSFNCTKHQEARYSLLSVEREHFGISSLQEAIFTGWYLHISLKDGSSGSNGDKMRGKVGNPWEPTVF